MLERDYDIVWEKVSSETCKISLIFIWLLSTIWGFWNYFWQKDNMGSALWNFVITFW